MNTIQNVAQGRMRFFQTELATARAFLDIAETSPEEKALHRNVRNAEASITAIRAALAERDIAPEHADEIRTAADALADQLERLTTPVKFS